MAGKPKNAPVVVESSAPVVEQPETKRETHHLVLLGQGEDRVPVRVCHGRRFAVDQAFATKIASAKVSFKLANGTHVYRGAEYDLMAQPWVIDWITRKYVKGA